MTSVSERTNTKSGVSGCRGRGAGDLIAEGVEAFDGVIFGFGRVASGGEVDSFHPRRTATLL